MMTEWYWSGTLYAFARVCNLDVLKIHNRNKSVADPTDKFCNKEFPIAGNTCEMKINIV